MKESISPINSTLKDILRAINEEPYGIAFVVDQKGVLCGVVTDGDARRLILSGLGLNDIVTKSHLRQDFIFGKKDDSLPELLKKSNRKVRIIPIIDEDGQPVDYFRYEHRTHFTPIAQPDLENKELEFLLDAYLSTWISSKGEYINRFETEFARYCGANHGLAVSNGTVALHIALVALGIGPGDEVIVPDLTFAATINTVLHAGATPVVVDVEKDFWTIDPECIRKAITPRTKAIIPVHIYGQPCDMDQIMGIANEHGLFVIEDCAEAHGAEFSGRKICSFGHISCFSFFANKIMTTGEGGMCLTSDSELNQKLRILRDHGMNPNRQYWHDVVGFNYRMTNLQAALGCAQLARIQDLIGVRQFVENGYRKIFSKEKKIQWQNDSDPRRKRVTWLVSALFEDRESWMNTFKSKQIEIRPFFYSLTEMPLYQKYAHSFENSREISRKGLCLPTTKDTNLELIAAAFGATGISR